MVEGLKLNENKELITMEDYINTELNNTMLRPLYLIIKEATEVYEELFQKEKEIFSGEYFEEIKGRLLGYIIKRAFDKKFIPKNFPFDVACRNMSFNQKRPEIKKGNILLTLSKVNDRNMLPNKSGYKIEYSKGNSLLSKQLMFEDINTIKDIPYYGILTYNYTDGVLNFVDIIFPDSKYNNVIKRVPIPMISVVENSVNDLKESSPLLKKEALKVELEKDVVNKKI